MTAYTDQAPVGFKKSVLKAALKHNEKLSRINRQTKKVKIEFPDPPAIQQGQPGLLQPQPIVNVNLDMSTSFNI